VYLILVSTGIDRGTSSVKNAAAIGSSVQVPFSSASRASASEQSSAYMTPSTAAVSRRSLIRSRRADRLRPLVPKF
jgi:hypothetical protein